MSSSFVSLELRVDWRILAFTAVVAPARTVVGLAPAWLATAQPNAAMKSGGREPPKAVRFGFGKALVIVRVALSLVLVAFAGLLVGTFESSPRWIRFRHERVLLAK